MTVQSTALTRDVNVALIQIRGGTTDQAANCDHMREEVLKAVKEGEASGKPVDMAVLGELWNSPIGTNWFDQMAEPVPQAGTPRDQFDEKSYTTMRLSRVAEEAGIWIIGGSIPERTNGKLNNCATIWNPSGELVKVYRKLHLFDLCLPTMTYRESDQFAPGREMCLFDTPFGRFGLALCYDIRFPELAAIAARKGANAMFYPAAFNCVTGPLHWELLQRSRALDNQIYVCTCSPARDPTASFVIYGHSMASSPMGQVIVSAKTEPTTLHVTFEPKAIADTRAGIPLASQRRFDIYADVASAAPSAKKAVAL